MEAVLELVIVALAVLASCGYLLLRFLRQRRNRLSGSTACGRGACSCSGRTAPVKGSTQP